MIQRKLLILKISNTNTKVVVNSGKWYNILTVKIMKREMHYGKGNSN